LDTGEQSYQERERERENKKLGIGFLFDREVIPWRVGLVAEAFMGGMPGREGCLGAVGFDKVRATWRR
jgi:hypothetical protein